MAGILNRLKNSFKKLFFKDETKFLNSPENSFEKRLGKKVDNILDYKIDDLDLSVRFEILYNNSLMVNGISSNDDRIKKYDINGTYPLVTKISKDQSLKLAKQFFSEIFPDKIDHFNSILNGQGKNSETQNIYLKFKEKSHEGSYCTSPAYPTDDIYINMQLCGDLSDVYSLVHEISHTIDAVNGTNETRAVLGEVVPQCMERMLDDFLVNLSNKELEEYNFNRNALNKDIKDRRLSTFIDRMRISKNIPYLEKSDKMQHSRYMLAQIYTDRFLKKFSNNEERKIKINEFAESIINNDITEANNVFGVELFENYKLRDRYIDDSIKSFISDVLDCNKELNQDELLYLKNKYKEKLSNEPKETVEKAFEVLEKWREQVSKGENPDKSMTAEAEKIFEFIEQYKSEIKESFIKSGGVLKHISPIEPANMQGRRIRKTIRPNNYETDIIEGVFASSDEIDGENPYIARDSNGMISIGPEVYVYAGDNIDVIKDKTGEKHAILKNPNYAYFLNPEEFEPVVGLKRDENGNPFLEFSREWISKNEINLEDKDRVYGLKKIKDVTDLLKNYQVLTDVKNQGIGRQMRSMGRDKIAKFTLEQIELGNLRYINEEVGINSIKDRKEDYERNNF